MSMPSTINSSIVLAAICVAAVPFSAVAHAANNFTSLYSFAGGPSPDVALVGRQLDSALSIRRGHTRQLVERLEIH